MSTSTSIEWTDVSWNPVRGCSLVSAGCANCYAMKFAHRFSGAGKPYEGLTELGPHGPRWTGKIQLVSEALDEPLHWKKPRRIFVNSMSDLFHEDVPDAFIASVYAVMVAAYQHDFQALTKRPERRRHLLAHQIFRNDVGLVAAKHINALRGPHSLNATGNLASWNAGAVPNIWEGVSVEDQKTADERIPKLLATSAAVRWVSAEPLLGPVDLEACLSGFGRALYDDGLNWVVVGGESGPGARPCDVAWICAIKDQCRCAGVPVFVKQLGSRPYAVEGSLAAQEWTASSASAVMDDCGWIHPKDRKGGDMHEWPIDLGVREWPR